MGSRLRQVVQVVKEGALALVIVQGRDTLNKMTENDRDYYLSQPSKNGSIASSKNEKCYIARLGVIRIV